MEGKADNEQIDLVPSLFLMLLGGVLGYGIGRDEMRGSMVRASLEVVRKCERLDAVKRGLTISDCLKRSYEKAEEEAFDPSYDGPESAGVPTASGDNDGTSSAMYFVDSDPHTKPTS